MSVRKDLESFIDEAIDSPEERDGICKDLYDYVRELVEDTEDQSFIKGAKSTLWGRRTNEG